MKQPEDFEAQMHELETIVDELSHTTNLEEALKKFERGLVLADSATKRLNTIENRLIEIKEKFHLRGEDSASPPADVDEPTL